MRLQGPGQRHYSPGLARWLSRDPIGEWGGINIYSFVGNMVFELIDYLGLNGCCTCLDINISSTFNGESFSIAPRMRWRNWDFDMWIGDELKVDANWVGQESDCLITWDEYGSASITTPDGKTKTVVLEKSAVISDGFVDHPGHFWDPPFPGPAGQYTLRMDFVITVECNGTDGSVAQDQMWAHDTLTYTLDKNGNPPGNWRW